MVRLSRESARRPEQVLKVKYKRPASQELLVNTRRSLEEPQDDKFILIEDLSSENVVSFWCLKDNDTISEDELIPSGETHTDIPYSFVKLC